MIKTHPIYNGIATDKNGNIYKMTKNGFVAKKCYKTKNGYFMTRVTFGKYQSHNRFLHHLVWECQTQTTPHWNDLSSSGMTINHKNEIKTDNRFDNLEMMTRSQNLSYSHTGEDNPAAKLTEDDVRSIRKEYKKNDTSYNKLAKKYKISKPIIMRIMNGTAWKSVV